MVLFLMSVMTAVSCLFMRVWSFFAVYLKRASSSSISASAFALVSFQFLRKEVNYRSREERFFSKDIFRLTRSLVALDLTTFSSSWVSSTYRLRSSFDYRR